MSKFLKKIADWVDPNYWAEKIGDKTLSYVKNNFLIILLFLKFKPLNIKGYTS